MSRFPQNLVFWLPHSFAPRIVLMISYEKQKLLQKSVYYTWTVTCFMVFQAIPDILVAQKTLVSTPQSPGEGRQGERVLIFSFCASNKFAALELHWTAVTTTTA